MYGASVDEMDDVVAEFFVHRAQHNLLRHPVSAHGHNNDCSNHSVTKKLSAENHVYVYIPSQQSRETYVTLEGAYKNVFKALDTCLGIINDNLVYVTSEEVKELESLTGQNNAAASSASETCGNDRSKAVIRDKPDSTVKSRDALPPLVCSAKLYSSCPYRVIPKPHQYSLIPNPSPQKHRGSKEKWASKKFDQSCEIVVDIPSSIIGLLLAKRSANSNTRPSNVLTQIQTYTGTIISKLVPYPVEAFSSKEGISKNKAAKAKATVDSKAAAVDDLARKEQLKLINRSMTRNAVAAISVDQYGGKGNKMEALAIDDDDSYVSVQEHMEDASYDSEGFADAPEGDLDSLSSRSDSSAESVDSAVPVTDIDPKILEILECNIENNSASKRDNDVVKFRVRGSNISTIENAINTLRLIVGGKDIKCVLGDLLSMSNHTDTSLKSKKKHRAATMMDGPPSQMNTERTNSNVKPKSNKEDKNKQAIKSSSESTIAKQTNKKSRKSEKINKPFVK